MITDTHILRWIKLGKTPKEICEERSLPSVRVDRVFDKFIYQLEKDASCVGFGGKKEPYWEDEQMYATDYNPFVGLKISDVEKEKGKTV